MQHTDHEVLNVSLVLLGNFNPAIFQPQWLVDKKLIMESEGDPSNLKVIHPELALLETDNFKLEVRPSRFELQTLQEPFLEPLKDLCASIFKLLGETPISAFGINYTKHYRFEDEKDYIKFGYHLSPIQQNFDFLGEPRLLEILITDRKADTPKDVPITNVKIFPSDIRPHNTVAINVNTHYNLKTDGRGISVFLIDNWEEIIVKSDNILKNIWTKFKH